MKTHFKKIAALAVTLIMIISLSACGSKSENNADTLVYGSHDYTAINPALYEHGEINSLIFAGLTAHDKDNKLVPALAEKWEYDAATHTWTFHLRDGLKFHDGKDLTSEDVKFTLEAILDKKNNSEIVSNYQDITNITCPDKKTVVIKLSKENVAFADYMTIGILPKHLLKGKKLATAEFNQKPVGAGPYKLISWDEGQSITLEKFDGYYAGKPHIKKIIFKIVEDSDARLLQLKSGDLDMAQIEPKQAKSLKKDSKDFDIYRMNTADYRAIAYNYAGSKLFKTYPELANILSYGIDREAIIKSALLGEGQVAYSPIQKNKFNSSDIEKFAYNPDKMEQLLQQDGWTKNKKGIYEKNGTELKFTITAMANDKVRVDMAKLCAEQLKAHGISVKAEARKELDWEKQDATIIGWGSPFDADDHTYKIFTSEAGDNYTGYANPAVDEALAKARATTKEPERQRYYSEFLRAMTKQMPYTFIAYIDADYAVKKDIKGITKDTMLGHHGVGIFWNVADWKLEK